MTLPRRPTAEIMAIDYAYGKTGWITRLNRVMTEKNRGTRYTRAVERNASSIARTAFFSIPVLRYAWSFSIRRRF